MIAVRVVAMVPVLVVLLGSGKRSSIDHSKQVVRWPPPGSPAGSHHSYTQKQAPVVVVFVSCSGDDCHKMNGEAHRFLSKQKASAKHALPSKQTSLPSTRPWRALAHTWCFSTLTSYVEGGRVSACTAALFRSDETLSVGILHVDLAFQVGLPLRLYLSRSSQSHPLLTPQARRFGLAAAAPSPPTPLSLRPSLSSRSSSPLQRAGSLLFVPLSVYYYHACLKLQQQSVSPRPPPRPPPSPGHQRHARLLPPRARCP